MNRILYLLIIGTGILSQLMAQETIQPLPALDRSSLERVVLPAKSYFEVDALNYLHKHDIVYQSSMLGGFEGFPQGNGDLGGMIWTEDEGIVIQINKSNLFDLPNPETTSALRSAARFKLNLGAPAFKWLFLKEFESRLSFTDASVKVHSETPFMTTDIKSYVCADRNLWVLDCSITGSGEEGGTVKKVELERYGSRTIPRWESRMNPDPVHGLGTTQAKTDGGDLIVNEVFDTLKCSVGCRLIGVPSEPELISSRRAALKTEKRTTQHFKVLIAVSTSQESGDPQKAVKDALDRAEREQKNLYDSHREWWTDFWNRSFVHIQDDYVENLYYFRRYLMASGSRGLYPILFNGGIWIWNHDVRNWVDPHWWNQQDTYYGLGASNDCDLMLPLLDVYWRLKPFAASYAERRGYENSILWNERHGYRGEMFEGSIFAQNFTPAIQIGRFYWNYYAYTGDEIFLENIVYPFMKESAQFYLDYLQWDDEKEEYFINPALPYECAFGTFKNTITDLGMIQFGFSKLIEASKILRIDEDKRKQWQHVLDHLWDPPRDMWPELGEVFTHAYSKEGEPWPAGNDYGNTYRFQFSPGTSLVYPAEQIDLDDEGTRDYLNASRLIEIHPDTKNSITPDPIVAARLGMSDEVKRFFGNSIRWNQHFPQGFFYNLDQHHVPLSRYEDTLKQNPKVVRDHVYDQQYYQSNGRNGLRRSQEFLQAGMEPLCIMGAAVNEILLHSHDGKIRIFPAVDTRDEAAFTLRAQRGFMVSSEKGAEEEPSHVLVYSAMGNTCRMVNPWDTEKLMLVDDETGKKVKYSFKKDELSFRTNEGSSYLIYPAGKKPEKKTYAAERNEGPKYFHEAVLGRPRDY